MTSSPGPAALVLLGLLSGYRRWVSPLLGPRCRFAPTCSAYAVGAVQAHGAAHGAWLTVRRLLRCHPFHPGGHDPVPPVRRSWVTMESAAPRVPPAPPPAQSPAPPAAGPDPLDAPEQTRV
jgi:hypothetical protein